jgi:ribosome-binding factor A
MRGYARHERVAEEVREALATALQRDVHDPRLLEISITAVKLTPDLSQGRVFWMPITPEPLSERDRRPYERALRDAAGFLRSHVARSISIRAVPELTFEYDESIEYGRQMEEILDKVAAQAPAGDSTSADEPRNDD